MPLSLQTLKPYRHRLLALGIVVLSTLMSLAILLTRWIAVGHRLYGFLVWDLFRAWVPFWISLAIYVMHIRRTASRPSLLLLGIVWLAFFPNAPYLLTEFCHLGRARDGAWWCDMVMIVGIAANGLLLGLLSLYCMQQVVRARIGLRQSWWFVAFVIGLASFGISIGRFQRFNSWDIVRRPFGLVTVTMDEFIHPAEYPKRFATAALLCGFMSLAYLALWTLVTLHEDQRELAGPARSDGRKSSGGRPRS